MDVATALTWQKGVAIAGLALAFLDLIGRRDVVQGLLRLLMAFMLVSVIVVYLAADFYFTEILPWQTFAKEWSLRSYFQAVGESMGNSLMIFVIFCIPFLICHGLLKLSETRYAVTIVGFVLAAASLWLEYAS